MSRNLYLVTILTHPYPVIEKKQYLLKQMTWMKELFLQLHQETIRRNYLFEKKDFDNKDPVKQLFNAYRKRIKVLFMKSYIKVKVSGINVNPFVRTCG